MIPRTLTTTAVVAAAFAVAASTAWGSEPYRDHGDATNAKLAPQSPSLFTVRDHGDATAARLIPQSAPLVIIRDAGDATGAQLAVQPAFEVVRDGGDAAQAKLSVRPAPVVRDNGDASQAKLEAQSPEVPSTGQFESTSGWDVNWAQLGIGFGLGMLLVLGVTLAVRFTRGYRLAH